MSRITHRPLTVVALILSLFMGALEATVVSTAMPTVIGDLGGIHHYSWVFTAYLLASTVTVPINGKLADLYGRKPVILLGIALFLVGSAASGAAQSMTELIVFRTLQGLGAGAMQPMAMTIVGDIFDMEERAKMQGLFGAAWGIAGLMGPMVGGFIVEHASWRWVFYINVPFGLLAALMLVLFLHERVEKRVHALNLSGAALLTAGIVALLLAAQGGAALYLGAPAALLLLGAYGVVERRAKESLMPFELFRKPVLAVSSLAGALVGGAMISTVTFVPLFVQGVLRGSAKDAGSAITPMVVGWPIASALAGRLLMRVGFRPLVRGGLLLSAVSAVGLALVARPGCGIGVLSLSTAAFGAGLGFANTALIIAVQSSVSWTQRGIATSSTMFFRTIGGTLAVGVLGGVLAARLAVDPSLPVGAASLMLGPEHGKGLSPEVLASLQSALESGVTTILWLIAALGVAAFLTSLAFPIVAVQTTKVDVALE
jgi:EmrB/QacA subfamily drug resistance transporter